MKRHLAIFAIASLTASGLVALVSACTSNGSSTSDVGAIDGAVDASVDAGGPLDPGDAGDGGPGADSAPQPTTCALERAYVTGCNQGKPDGGEELTCGSAKFDAWCALNDQAINSAAFRRGEAMCLTQANCDPDQKHDCEYKTYGSATPTAAQKAVALAYCQTCEPADPTTCAARETTYRAALGPNSTDDVFVAAWELNDALDDEIRAKCTGAALDAGVSPDAGACLKQFASCAGDIYINHLPDCP